MSYVEQTLTDGEVVEQFLKFHWFYPIVPAIMIFLGVIGTIVGLFLVGSVENEAVHNIIGILLLLCILAVIVYFFDIFVRLITIYSTEQALTNKRVFRKTGLISRDTDELILEKIETIAINQSVLGRIFDYGDIEFTGTGGIYIRLTYVPNPTLVKKNFRYT